MDPTIQDVLNSIKENRTLVEGKFAEIPGIVTKEIEPVTARLGTIEKGQQTIEQRITAVEQRKPQIDVSDLDLSGLVANDPKRLRALGISQAVLRGWSPEKKQCFVALVRSVAMGRPMGEALRKQAGAFLGRATLTPDSGAGAYLEFDQFSRDIIRLVNEFSVVPSLCRFFPMTTDTLKLIVRKTGAAVAGKAPNTALGSFDVDFTQVAVNLQKIGGYTLLPVELLEDGNVNPSLADFIAMEIAMAISEKVDTDCILGDATATYDSIRGITNFTGTKSVVLPAGKTSANDVTSLLVRKCGPSLFAPARRNATWIGHESVLARLEELNKTDVAAPLVTYNNGEPLVARRPWVSSEAMLDVDSIGANSVIAVLGDYRFALLAARGGLSLANGMQELAIRLAQSEHVKFIEDQVAIKGTVRMDFQKLDANAFCLLKTAAA